MGSSASASISVLVKAMPACFRAFNSVGRCARARHRMPIDHSPSAVRFCISACTWRAMASASKVSSANSCSCSACGSLGSLWPGTRCAVAGEKRMAPSSGSELRGNKVENSSLFQSTNVLSERKFALSCSGSRATFGRPCCQHWLKIDTSASRKR